jgi:hypothetical protein
MVYGLVRVEVETKVSPEASVACLGEESSVFRERFHCYHNTKCWLVLPETRE